VFNRFLFAFLTLQLTQIKQLPKASILSTQPLNLVLGSHNEHSGHSYSHSPSSFTLLLLDRLSIIILNKKRGTGKKDMD
jgi:hypothetical protein